MNCADKIEFVAWDKRFSEADINAIKEAMITMMDENRKYKLVVIGGIEYEVVADLTTCDECPPNNRGQDTHYILIEVIEETTQICVFRDYKCGVSWYNPSSALQIELFGIPFWEVKGK